LKTPIDKKQAIQYKKYWHEEVRTDKIGNIFGARKGKI
jgi:hypothetical protein